MTWSPDTSCGYESRKIRHLLVPYTRGRGLDLGCGGERAFPHMIGVDNGAVYGIGNPAGAQIQADITKLSMFADASLDFVFSSHALEDLEDTVGALEEWWRVIRPGGYLCLYLPHKEFYPNIGQPGANPHHVHDFLPGDIYDAMTDVAEASGWGWLQVEDENRSRGDEYSFFQVYQKELEPTGCFDCGIWFRHPGGRKRCLVIRYGGYGDMMLVSSILPLLQEQGYHVTVNTTPRGQEPLLHDPNVDAWLIQDTDQVPNPWLHAYWQQLAERYDKIVNLSESIERTLLTNHGDLQHLWPDSVRRKLFGKVNYCERTHDIAEVPHRIRPRFYASREEMDWAKAERADFAPGGEPLVLWVLAGSSVHKVYPHQDAVIARLMLETDARVVMVGEPLCEILEMGWENEPRVIRRSGKWSIRESMAFAQMAADVVVGPETGVLNAVGHEPVRKVLLLSHSSADNLCKHWRNTRALAADVPCYPCHRMHKSRQFCVTEPTTGTALCAASIPPEAVYEAIAKGMKTRRAA